MSEAGAVALAFDYSDVPAVDKRDLEKRAEVVVEIQERQRKTTSENMLKMGLELKAAQAKFSAHRHGTFVRWCKERCGLSKSSAFRAIQVADAFSDFNRPSVGQFDPTALYLLAADTCPEEATEAAKEIAARGEPVTVELARELIEEHTVEADDADSHEAIQVESGRRDRVARESGEAVLNPEEDGDLEPEEEDLPDFKDALSSGQLTASICSQVRKWYRKAQPGDLDALLSILRDLVEEIEEVKLSRGVDRVPA